METATHRESAAYTWGVVMMLALLILLKGAFALKWIGDLGQPDWDFRPVNEVPAESPAAIYRPLPYPQHIRGPEGR